MEKDPNSPELVKSRTKSYLELVLLTELIQDKLEKLRDTPVYRQKFKFYASKLDEEAEKLLSREMGVIYTHEEVALNVCKALEKLIEQLRELEPIQILALSQRLPEIIKSLDTKGLDWIKI